MTGVHELTFIIVTWNTREMTRSCLISIQEADPSHAWEVVVVDNASKDGTPDMIRRDFPWVSLVVNEKNLGFARANNIALREVSTEFVMLLNSDTTLTPGAIPGLVRFMKSHPDVGVSGAQLVYPDGRLQNSIVPFPSLLTEMTNKSLLRLLFPRKYPGKGRRFEGPVEVDSIIGAAMMMRTEAVRSVGYFDEDYFLFLEETDLCFRIKKNGWRVFFLPDVRIVHHQGRSVRKVKARARVEYQRSLILFFEKNRGINEARIIHAFGYLKALISLLGALPAKILSDSSPSRWERYKYLLTWYHKGCPADMGLLSD